MILGYSSWFSLITYVVKGSLFFGCSRRKCEYRRENQRDGSMKAQSPAIAAFLKVVEGAKNASGLQKLKAARNGFPLMPPGRNQALRCLDLAKVRFTMAFDLQNFDNT